MKKILVIVSIFLFIACNKLEKDAFVIEGNITNFENGKTIYLEKFDEEKMQFVSFDTTNVKDGKFIFEGKTNDEPYVCYLRIDGLNNKPMFIMEHGTIEVTIDKDSMQNNKVKGTYNNDLLQNYNNFMLPIYKKMSSYQAENTEKINNAYATNNIKEIESLQNNYMKLVDEFGNKNLEFVNKNPKAVISLMILENMLNQQRGNIEDLKKAFENLSPDLKNLKAGKKINDYFKTVSGVSVGNQAPDFSGPTPEGKITSLKENLGKLTLIDFWAAWCGPCRRENPNVVKLYNDYKNKGFQIIGVSLDNAGENQKWKDAILADKLTWPQISNLKGWEDPIAQKYNVKAIPATFLVDAKGIIIAKDLRGEELRAKVAELLK